MDTQTDGRVAGAVDASATLPEHLFDVTTLHRIEGFIAFAFGLDSFLDAQRVIELQRAAAAADHRPLDDVLELTHVPGPLIALQSLHDSRRNPRDHTTQASLVTPNEEPDEQRDVVGSLA